MISDTNIMEFHQVSRKRFCNVVLCAIFGSIIVVTMIASLARAGYNFRAALTEKPDIAIYLLLPEEGITGTTLLREESDRRDYLVQTSDGPKLVILKKGEEQWFVSEVEKLRE